MRRLTEIELPSCEVELPSGEVVDERVYAQRCIQEWVARGPEGVEPLLEALRNPSSWSSMDVLAAEALGDIEDERVLPALLEAFRSCFVGRSSRLHLSLGILAAGLSATGLLMPVIGRSSWVFGLPLCVWAGTWLSFHIRQPRYSTQLLEAVTASILRIAERNPSSQMAAIVEDLKVVAADRIQQGPNTRRTAREAYTRLKELTDGTRSLPLLSQAPPASPETLPHPAHAPEVQADTLPRIRE